MFFRIEALGDRSAARFFAVHGLAELQIGTETALAAGDFLAGLGIGADLDPVGWNRGGRVAARRHRPRELAFGIIRAADERAELAEFQ